MICNQVVAGINSDSLNKRLLADPNLTLAKTTELLQIEEQVSRDAGVMRQDRTTTGQVYKVDAYRKESRSNHEQAGQDKMIKNSAKRCNRCGLKNFNGQCKAINAVC